MTRLQLFIATAEAGRVWNRARSRCVIMGT